MAREPRDSGTFELSSLYGMRPADDETILRGMSVIEGQFQREFDHRLAVERQRAELNAPLRERLVEALGGDGTLERYVQNAARLDAAASRTRLEVPTAPADEQRIFTGSLGATVTPLLNYDWTWFAETGGPTVEVHADRSSGDLGFRLWDNSNQESSASGSAAVGIFFRPAVPNGILRLTSNPAYSYHWGTFCANASASSRGWLGLYVGRYSLAGGFDGAPISQQIDLWNESSWWSGTGGNTGSTSGYPLFAQFSVSSSYYYALWVWCGGSISAAGWSGTFTGSGAGSVMDLEVPSITWELF